MRVVNQISPWLVTDAYYRAKHPAVVMQLLRILLDKNPEEWSRLGEDLRNDESAREVFRRSIEGKDIANFPVAYIKFHVNDWDDPKVKTNLIEAAKNVYQYWTGTGATEWPQFVNAILPETLRKKPEIIACQKQVLAERKQYLEALEEWGHQPLGGSTEPDSQSLRAQLSALFRKPFAT